MWRSVSIRLSNGLGGLGCVFDRPAPHSKVMGLEDSRHPFCHLAPGSYHHQTLTNGNDRA